MPYFVVIRERGPRWDWSRTMRRQDEWDAHAAFMDALESEGFVLAGGPLGTEDQAMRTMHVIWARDVGSVEARFDADPWTATRHLVTANIEPWTILLGGFASSPNSNQLK